MPTSATRTADVVYYGRRLPGGSVEILVEDLDGQQLGAVRHVVRHSPTGMNWGYGGSGAADCARSLLLDVLGPASRCGMCNGTGRVVLDPNEGGCEDTTPYQPERSPRSYADDGLEVTSCWSLDCDDGYRAVPYQDFKWAYVSGWGDEWTMRRSEILTWLQDATVARAEASSG